MKMEMNGVDLTGFINDMTVVGLQQQTFTLSGTFDGTPAAFFPVPEPRVAMSYKVPDGKWQAFKFRLKQYRWLKWIPVRMVNYTWTGIIQSWTDTDGESGITLAVDPGEPIKRSVQRTNTPERLT